MQDRPVKELAQQLGRSVASIYARRERIRNPGRGWQRFKERRQQRPELSDLRRERSARNYAKGATHTDNAHKPWTDEEIRAITDPNKPSDRALAKKLGRTVRAIQGKRHIVGGMSASNSS